MELLNIKDGENGGFLRTSDGAYIYFEEYGDKEKTSIVLIPGFCCSTFFFKKDIDLLKDDFHVVTYDPRGQGKSSKGLFGHTVERNATDLRELLVLLEINNACIVAWSMAGQFIMKYYDMYENERIGSIVLADCPLGAMYKTDWNAHGLSKKGMDLFNAHLKESYAEYEAYCEGFAKKIWGGIDDSMISVSTSEFLNTPPWIAFAIYSDMVFTNCFDTLSKVEIPMAFMGANSKVTENGIDLATKWYPEQLNENVYRESHSFNEGGHVFFMVEAELFVERLKGFIKKTL